MISYGDRTKLLLACASVIMPLLIPAAYSQSESAQPAVRLNVLVIDKSGQPVMGLHKEDFLVFEDSKVQTVSFFSTEEVPLTFALIVDNTGSVRPRLKEIVETAKIIISKSQPSDQVFLIRLANEKLEIVESLTSNKAHLLNTLSTFNAASGPGSLIDTIHASSEHVARNSLRSGTGYRRMALILLTDGVEKGGKKKMDELLKRLHGDDMQVFAISFPASADLPDRSSIFSNRRGIMAARFLKKIAKETGGLAFFPESQAELRPVADEILSYLRKQYIIEYTPTKPFTKEELRKVRVKIADAPGRDRYSAHTRLRYASPGK